MEVTILGSGTGVPALKRNAAGLLIKVENENLLFDSGPGIIRKLLELGLTYHDIDYIFYTHFHTDHTLDLATLLFAAKYAVSLRTKKLTLIGAEGLAAFYSGLLDLYKDVLSPQVYEVNFREIKETVLEFGQYQIKSMPMSHTPQSLGYRVESGSGVVVYSGDTDVCENIIKLGKDADILILDCSFPDQMKVPGHLTPQEAGRIAHQANCRTLVLTHLYPVCQEAVLIQQAKQTFRGNIVVASDLMTIKP